MTRRISARAVKTNCRGEGIRKAVQLFLSGIRGGRRSCAGRLSEFAVLKNIDSLAKRSFDYVRRPRACVRACGYAHACIYIYVRVHARTRARVSAAVTIFTRACSSQPARGYRFDSSHSSKSNKKLIESVTPPDFTNEISKYQFHVTLF